MRIIFGGHCGWWPKWNSCSWLHGASFAWAIHNFSFAWLKFWAMHGQYWIDDHLLGSYGHLMLSRLFIQNLFSLVGVDENQIDVVVDLLLPSSTPCAHTLLGEQSLRNPSCLSSCSGIVRLSGFWVAQRVCDCSTIFLFLLRSTNSRWPFPTIICTASTSSFHQLVRLHRSRVAYD
jgi:hypothetical protein